MSDFDENMSVIKGLLEKYYPDSVALENLNNLIENIELLSNI